MQQKLPGFFACFKSAELEQINLSHAEAFCGFFFVFFFKEAELITKLMHRISGVIYYFYEYLLSAYSMLMTLVISENKNINKV